MSEGKEKYYASRRFTFNPAEQIYLEKKGKLNEENLHRTIPFDVEVIDLNLSAPPIIKTIMGVPYSRNKNSVKVILENVNVLCPSGELTALLGGSGSGKTTLLNAIAGRDTQLLRTGSVTYHSDSNHAGNGKDSVGYVRQDDFLLPYLTVLETITFAAELRLPKSVSAEVREQIVKETIFELGLEDCQNTLIGGGRRKGISGGEKRRVSIGCALVTLPSILVLDEPTTGLDSFSSAILLSLLSLLAKRGRSIIISIHQPRSESFEIFDRVCLLSGGRVVYSGLKDEMLDHFSSQGFSLTPGTNPLDFVIDISSLDTRTDASEKATEARVSKLVNSWRNQESKMSSKSSSRMSPSPETSPIITELDQNFIRPGYGQQISILTRRGVRNVLRNYSMLVGLFLQAIVLGVSLGLAFYKLPETPAGIQSLKTLLYQFLPAFYYQSIVIGVFIWTVELQVFDREQEDNLYSVAPWVIASILSLLPALIIFPMIYALILYGMVGLASRNNSLIMFLVQNAMQQLGAFAYALWAASLSRSFAGASFIANGFSIIFVLSSGYLIIQLPVWVNWSKWISPYFYGFVWIARLQFEGRTFSCNGFEGVVRSQCDGNNVLVGLNFPLASPIYVFPLGLLGFIIVMFTVATIILTFYHPGGVKHAQSQPSSKEVFDLEAITEATDKPGVDIIVKNVSLTVSSSSLTSKLGKKVEEKVILSNLSAHFPSNKVTAIMGSSGAGKSSLLQLLADRLPSNFNQSGSFRFDGDDGAKVAFVEQEDNHHLPCLTVRETLRYAASLRLKGMTASQRYARAEEVLRALGLKSAADNLVGSAVIKGISGGEKRRLSLAVEMLSDPSILIADEPLSGLDSSTALNVMLLLKDIASSGRTVIITVHQPRSDVWILFDQVLLMIKGGRAVYSGPREGILDSFANSGFSCPKNFNPADFILDAASIDNRSEESSKISTARVAQLLLDWERTPLELSEKYSSNIEPLKRKKSSFIVALTVLLFRSIKNLGREKDAQIARVINPPFVALLFFLFFGRLDLSPSSVQTRIGLLQETTALPFVGMLSCLSIFPQERSLYFHEYRTSARVTPFTFLAAYTIQETLITVVSSLGFSLVMTFGIGLRSSARIFIEFWASSFCLLSMGESIGIVFCAFVENGGLAISLVSTVITIAAQLNGIISVSLPEWLQIVGWALPLKTQVRVITINELDGLVFQCDPASLASGACLAPNGNDLLNTFGIEASGTGKFLGILVALVILYRIISLFALQLRVASL